MPLPAETLKDHELSLCSMCLAFGIKDADMDTSDEEFMPMLSRFRDEFDAVFIEHGQKLSFLDTLHRNGVNAQVLDLLFEIYKLRSPYDKRARRLGRAFASAARVAKEKGCYAFLTYNSNLQKDDQLLVENATDFMCLNTVYEHLITIVGTLECKYQNLKRRRAREDLIETHSFDGTVVSAQHAFTRVLLDEGIDIVKIDHGTRSAGIFVPYAALSCIPLMQFKDPLDEKVARPYRQKDKDGDVLDGWTMIISECINQLWKIGELLADGKKVDEYMGGLRAKMISVMQYFARLVTISLACTGHMRSEDWYDVYCRTVFGKDLQYDDNHQETDGSMPAVSVPGTNFRNLVWNLEEILKQLAQAQNKCLTGVLCVVTGIQMKKEDKSSGNKSNRSPVVRPGTEYSVNALVDPHWGVMAAGNSLVIARGLLELYNRIAKKLGEKPLCYRSVWEPHRVDAKRAAQKKSRGGPSFIAHSLNLTMGEWKGCCQIKTALDVKTLTGIKSVAKKWSSKINRDVWRIPQEWTDTLEADALPGQDKQNIRAWKRPGVGMVRCGFESDLECGTGEGPHILAVYGPMIGHESSTQKIHYVKPSISVKWTVEGQTYTLDTSRKGVHSVSCTLVKEGVLRCGDFGVNASCDCSRHAVDFRADNQSEWMRSVEIKEAPAISSGDAAHLRELVKQSKVAIEQLFRPIPKIHARWKSESQQQRDGVEAVRKFDEAQNKLCNHVITSVRDVFKFTKVAPSDDRLLGVSSSPMAAAKMFGPWVHHFDMLDESEYQRQLSVGTGWVEKRKAYVRTCRGIAPATETPADAQRIARLTEELAAERRRREKDARTIKKLLKVNKKHNRGSRRGTSVGTGESTRLSDGESISDGESTRLSSRTSTGLSSDKSSSLGSVGEAPSRSTSRHERDNGADSYVHGAPSFVNAVSNRTEPGTRTGSRAGPSAKSRSGQSGSVSTKGTRRSHGAVSKKSTTSASKRKRSQSESIESDEESVGAVGDVEHQSAVAEPSRSVQSGQNRRKSKRDRKKNRRLKSYTQGSRLTEVLGQTEKHEALWRDYNVNVEEILAGPETRGNNTRHWLVRWGPTVLPHEEAVKCKDEIAETFKIGSSGRKVKVYWKDSWEPRKVFVLESGEINEVWQEYEENRKEEEKIAKGR